MNAFEEKMRERREGIVEGRKEGERIGEAAKQQEIARKMLEKGLDLMLIQEMTGLSQKKIKSL